MFTAQGRILLKEKETGTPEEQLRSLASVKLQADIKDEHDKLAKCQELQETIVNGNSVLAPLKTSQNILKLLKAYAQNFKQLQVPPPPRSCILAASV